MSVERVVGTIPCHRCRSARCTPRCLVCAGFGHLAVWSDGYAGALRQHVPDDALDFVAPVEGDGE